MDDLLTTAAPGQPALSSAVFVGNSRRSLFIRVAHLRTVGPERRP
jgi:hypothetical protein